MAEHISIRRCGSEDARAVQRLLLATWHDTYDQLIGAEKVAEISRNWHSADILGAQIDDPEHVFLVAEQDGTINGHAHAFQAEQGVIHLSRLYILPAEQGRGVGKALVNSVVAAFPGARKMRLEVHERQEDAHRFYQACGFETVGKTAHCGTASDIPALIMEKKLGAQ